MNKTPYPIPTTPWGQTDRRCRRGDALTSILLVGGLLTFDPAFAAASGSLSDLVVPNLSPAFDPNVTQYTVPKPASCAVSITATVAAPTSNTRLYVGNNPTQNGATVNAWICNSTNKASIVIYENWTEVGRYTISAVDAPPPPPPPPPISGKLTSLTVANLSPAFDPNVKDYTVPMPANCTVPVTAVAENADHANFRMYVAHNPVPSGTLVNAWVCDGHTKVDIAIYDVWNEVGHYTITPVGEPAPPPNPTPTPDPTPTPPPASEPTPTPEPAPNPPPLPAQVSPVNDKDTVVRFLERATFGPTPADIAAVQQVGFEYWMAQQANLPASTLPDGHDMGPLLSQQFLNMYGGPDQLRQRMVFALSQILVVSSNKNIYGDELAPYVRLLAKHAFGNYRSLLREMTLSPAMGKYLDLANSTKATANTSPNENYPRELLQLFGIGLTQLNQDGSVKLNAQGQPIPTYDQTTLREVARALTGWTYPTAPGATPASHNHEYFVGLMEPRPQNHDTGSKTLLNGTVVPANQTVTQDLDAVIDNLFQHPNMPPFMATRLIRLAGGISNPSPAYIERVADVFENNGQGVRGDLWATLKAVLTDAEATNPPTLHSGHLMDPVLHVMNLGRALGAQVTDPNMFMYLFRNLGQQVLSPDTVFSYYSPLAGLPGHPGLFGPEFQIYTPGLAIERANLIHQILSGQLGSSFSVNLGPFVALGNDPAALVEKVNQVLFQGRMSSELRQIILTATQAGYDANQRAFGAVYLAAISSEYAVRR
jgi:hypothetical protein